jgi:hypothetical protein
VVSRRHGLLVRLLRQLQPQELRSHAGMLRRTRQRPSKRRERGRSRRRRGSPGPRTGSRQGAGPSVPPPSPPRGPTSTRNCLKRASSKPSLRRSTVRCGCFEPPSPGKPPRARRTRVRAGQAGPRPHQRRLRCRQPEHAPTSEPEARRRRDTATSHARSINTRGAKPALRGACAHRASDRAAG